MGGFVSNALGLGTGSVTSAAGNNGIMSHQDLVPQLNVANAGIASNIENQNSFAQALQNQMNGGGPNLANSLLANATGQNVSNQAALMASQRGAGSNAGLIARNAARQGAENQQTAAGQASVNRQQQQLGAQSQLGNVYGQIGQEQGNRFSTLAGEQKDQNNATVGATNAANSLNNQIAQNNQQVGMSVIQGVGSAAAGGMGGGGGAGAMKGAFGAEGGEIDQSGFESPINYSSELPDHLKDVSELYHPHMSHNYAKGGKVQAVKAMVSPGEKVLEPKDVKMVKGGKVNPMEVGKTVPGKPKVPGPVNSYANDIVPKNLKVNSIVLPRSVTQSKDPAKDAAKFVQAILDKQGKKKVKS